MERQALVFYPSGTCSGFAPADGGQNHNRCREITFRWKKPFPIRRS